MEVLAQCIIDVFAWLLPGFCIVLVVNWLVSLFDRY